jgi:hypothetical protein
MRDWYRVLDKQLTVPLREAGTPDARALIARLSVRMFHRRWEQLSRGRELPHGDERALALVMSSLYRTSGTPKAAWIMGGLGGGPRSLAERARGRMIMTKLSPRERWEEVATHLGELLIVLTEDLPPYLPHARRILGDICFDAGARYAERVKKGFGIPDVPSDPPAVAMEVLRMSEYVFRVNPEHWGESDGTAGFLEGTACPWYERPGWNGAHCGIFGQFQSGIASVFGLRYHLSKTIPKHGGHTCRIDVKPIALGRKRTDATGDSLDAQNLPK